MREARFWEWVAALQPDELETLVRSLPPEEAAILHGDWPTWAHDGQCAPASCADGSEWRTWVLMAGRGFGKTLAGSQWIAGLVATGEPLRIALVGATIDEARRIMVEGRSGLLTVAAPWIADWHPSRRLLRFTTGTEATLFSGASPEALRGPEHHLAWCDELAKWEKSGECWDMLQLGLRLGERPRALVTTTPRPGPVLRRIMGEGGCVVTGGRTHANPHLPAAFLAAIEAQYGSTRLGRQEVEGELFTDAAGALWTVEGLERCRVVTAEPARPERRPQAVVEGRLEQTNRITPLDYARDERKATCTILTKLVIGVDPPAAGGTCGIVACALGPDGIGHVLADHSVTGRSPEGWARAVADAAALWEAEAARPERRAGRAVESPVPRRETFDHRELRAPPPVEPSSAPVMIVAEQNQGGAMVRAVLHAADPALAVKLVNATQGKSARAEPVAMLFEAGRVRLHGRFPELQAQLMGMIAGGGYEGPGVSPDRADAMVWALTELMVGRRGEPRVSAP